jgi:cell division protein FtsB
MNVTLIYGSLSFFLLVVLIAHVKVTKRMMTKLSKKIRLQNQMLQSSDRMIEKLMQSNHELKEKVTTLKDICADQTELIGNLKKDQQ